MKRSVLAACALFVCLLGLFFSVPAACAAGTDLTPKWQVSFPDSVRWYVRTSLGVLLVRSGHALTAIDGVDGKQLWSLPEIEISGGWQGASSLARRGNNLLEIPGYSILLINRAKLDKTKAKTGELLAIDLWTGKVLWREPELDDFVALLPRYESGKALLVTRKRAAMSRKNFIVATIPYADLATLPYNSVSFRAQLSFINLATGYTEWKSEYPRPFGPNFFFDVRELYGRLFLQEADFTGASALGVVDFETGQKLWEFNGPSNLSLLNAPTLQAMADHVILGDSGVVALDPGSGNAAWNSPKIGSIAGLIADGDVLLGIAAKGAFALDAKTGNVRWQTHGWGQATNAVLYKESNLLVFCGVSEAIVLDASSGQLVRKIPLYLNNQPFWISRVGKKFLLVFDVSEAGVYDVEAGKKIALQGRTKATLPAVSFLMRQYMPAEGASEPPRDMRRDLQQAWPFILERNQNTEDGSKTIERLKLFLDGGDDGFDSSDATVYATELGDWTLWRVNPETGVMEGVDFKGSQPDVSLALGLVYFVDDRKLEAVPWSSSFKRYRFVPPPPH